MCGAPGYLRQEFQELELMDEITWFQFEAKILPSIKGNLRNSLIRQYQLLKDELYVPDVVLDTLKWTKSEDSEDSYRQQLIEKIKEKDTKYTPASGTVTIDNKTCGSEPLQCMAVTSLNLLPALLFSVWRSNSVTERL